MSSYLSYLTTLSHGDAIEAAALLHDASLLNGREVQAYFAPNAGRITAKSLCEKIHSNSFLKEVCKRRDISYATPSLAFCLLCAAKKAGRGLLFIFLFPTSILITLYARYQLEESSADLRPLNPMHNIPAGNGPLPAEEYIERVNGTEILRRAGKEIKQSGGKTNSLSDCYYEAVSHRVTLPLHIVKASTPFARAIVAHECGHAEQRKFLLAKLGITIFSAFAALVSGLFLSAAVLPGVFGTIFGLSLLWLLCMPVTTFLYEVNASFRGMANLLTYDFITTAEDAKRAVETVQFAAVTYLAEIPNKMMEILLEIRRQDGGEKAPMGQFPQMW